MAEKHVLVKQTITQIEDGRRYKGTMKMGGVELSWELVFGIRIPDLTTIDPPSQVSDLRALFPITLMRNHVTVRMTDDEYMFFFSTLLPFAVDFFNNPQTRDNNGPGLLGQTLRGTSAASMFLGASMEIGMSREVTYELPDSTCDMLSDPKFACSFVE
jgi:hypothetical protein